MAGIPNNHLARTSAILTALKAAVEAITWTRAGGTAEPALQAVEIYDLRDLFTAMKEMIATKSRIALVILEGGDFANVTEGRELRARQTRRVTILLADRNWGDRQQGYMGDEKNPGAYTLADLVSEQLRGPLTGVDQVYIRPVSIEPMLITGMERQNQVGRAAVAVALEIVGGEILVSLGNRTY